MFFRKHRDLGARERHTLAETTYAVLRQRLLLPAPGAAGKFNEKGAPERRLAILAWQGNEAFLRGALTAQEQQWLAEVQKPSTAAALPEKLRHNLPDWLANPLRESWATSSGRWCEELARPRRWTCASTPEGQAR
jgi:16S rRNA (cytosine967-C5)-methyltransferase